MMQAGLGSGGRVRELEGDVLLEVFALDEC